MSLATITFFYTSSRLMGGLDLLSVVVRRYSPASRHWSFARIIIFHVSPHGDSLVHSYKVVNIGRSNSFWYFIMYTGYRFPLLSSHVDTDGSGEVPGSGSRIDSLVDFFAWGYGLLGGLQLWGFPWLIAVSVLLIVGVLQVYYGVHNNIFVVGIYVFYVSDHSYGGLVSPYLPLLWCSKCGADIYPI